MQKPLFSHNTPRGIRSRLLRPRTQPKKSGTGAPPAAQHTAQSVAGRVAVGPWQGPFGADMGPTPASMPAVYSNPSGRVFASLSGGRADLVACASMDLASGTGDALVASEAGSAAVAQPARERKAQLKASCGERQPRPGP
jgi:hypothetical protein